jgi:hypothetical protein
LPKKQTQQTKKLKDAVSSDQSIPYEALFQRIHYKMVKETKVFSEPLKVSKSNYWQLSAYYFSSIQ